MKMVGKSKYGVALVFLLSCSLLGCSNAYKYPYAYKVEHFENHIAITTDASKRSLLINQKTGRSCSEPAPDAIGTIATSLAAKLSAEVENPTTGTKAKGDGSLDTSTQTAITQLFQRSQGVQVLRDGMFRLCEAHLNGALDAPTYRLSVLSLITTLNYVVPMELCARMVSNGNSNPQIHEIFKNCVAASYNLASAVNAQSTDALSEIEKSEGQKAVNYSEFLKLQQPNKVTNSPK
jgi:hypothetical protein